MAAERSFRITPGGLATSYALFGGLYILFSDNLLMRFAGELSFYRQLQTAKGWAFILLTALALWVLTRQMRARLTEVTDTADLAEDQVRLAMNSANGMIWSLLLPEGGPPSWSFSGGLAASLGLGAGPLATPEIIDTLHPTERDAFTAWVAAIATATPPQDDLFRFASPDGPVFWIKFVQDPGVRHHGRGNLHFGMAFDLTRQQETAQDLAEVIYGAELGTWRLDIRTGVNQINDRWAEILGQTRAEMEPVTVDDFFALVHPDDRSVLLAKQADRRKRRDYLTTDEFRMRHKAGHWVWVLSRSRPVEYSATGEPLVLSGVHIDVTPRKELEVALKLERDFLDSLTQTTVAGILAMRSDGKVSFANGEAADILGMAVVDLVETPLATACKGMSDLEGKPLPLADYPFRKALAPKASVRDQRVLITLLDGRTKAISVSAAPMTLPDGSLQVVASVIDISAQVANEIALFVAAEEAKATALRDAMTGLPNRKCFEAELQRVIDAGGQVMHVFLDLDNFKQVNDRFGHRVGDLLICEAARRLEALRLPGQVLARVAGDEFTLLHPLRPGEDVETIAARLASAFDAPFDLEGRLVFSTVSMGISLHPGHADTMEDLMVNADLAMYEAKARGRNQTVRYTPDLRAAQVEEARIAQVLQNALKAQAFEVVLQPQWHLDRLGVLAGAEALLRCTDPAMAGLGPGVFLPIAARAGLMRAIDLMVIDLVGQAAAHLRVKGKGTRIAINLSPDSLQKPDFGRALLRQLEEAALRPGDILFELTEGALVDLSLNAGETLELLHANGFALSADDFGTGYSSLSYLHRLRLAEVKIDRSFIHRLGAREEASDDIVKAILAMCRSLKVRALAEGIETEGQAAWLRRNGCDLGQGFFLGKGLSIAEFSAMNWSGERDERPKEQFVAE
jgi:diguanylate cyclase (GGDEF)-like protein/PAS domain S-box-containing protein